MDKDSKGIFNFILLISLAVAIFMPSTSSLAANEDVKQSVTDLQTAIIDKIDYDVDITATSFADTKNINQSRWWADIFGLILDGIKFSLTTLNTFIETIAVGDDPSDALQLTFDNADLDPVNIAGLVMSINQLKQAGENYVLAVSGPDYNSLVSDLLDNSESGWCFLGQCWYWNYPEYKNNIKTNIYDYNNQGISPLYIPHKSTEILRRNNEEIIGAQKAKQYVYSEFSKLLQDIENINLPIDVANSITDMVNQIRTKIIESKLRSSTVTYETYLQNGDQYQLTNMSVDLGAIASLEDLRRFALTNYADNLDIEYITTAIGSLGAIIDAANIYSTLTLRDPTTKEVFGISQKAYFAFEFGGFVAEKISLTNARELIDLIPQDMLMSINGEISNIFLIVDDISYIPQVGHS